VALALYRKYRPRTFAEVIGQEHVTEPLSQALRSGRLHHAYLFSGPRGCGKTSSARILARSLNCEQGPTPEPCGACASCRSLANDGVGSIDVIEIDAASHGGVDDARDLREKAFFAPASSRYKIYVIDEAHMVSSAGFNALLKLVEEPPDYVKFIFATTEPEKVLGTIKSRTHHYPFRLIPPAVLRPYLQQLAEAEGIHVEPAVFPLVVRAGGGSARDSMSVLDQLIAGAGSEGVTYNRAVSLLGVTDVALIDEMCDALAAGDGATAFATIDRVAEAGHDARRFASDLLERFRDLIILQQVPDAVAKGLIDGPADQLDAMSAQATRLGPATLSRCADIVHNGLVEMRGTTAPRLLLELITARMLLPSGDDSAGALLHRLERMERRLTLTDGAAGPSRSQTPDPVRPQHSPAPPTGTSTADASPGNHADPSPGNKADPSPGNEADPSPGNEAGPGRGNVAGRGNEADSGHGNEPAADAPGRPGGNGISAARAAAAAASRRAPAGLNPVGAPRTGTPQDPASPGAQFSTPPGVDGRSASEAPGSMQPQGGYLAGAGRETAGPASVDGWDDEWASVPPEPGFGVDQWSPAPEQAASVYHDTDESDWAQAGPAPQVQRREPAGLLPDSPEQPGDAPPADAPGQLTAAAIREVWPEIVTVVGRQSKKIAALASGATVRDLDGETVVLTFRFPAHARMVAAEPDLIANSLYEALGGRWQIRCEVAGEAGGAPATASAPTRQPAAPAQGQTHPAPNAAPASQRGTAAPARGPQGGPAQDAGPAGQRGTAAPARGPQGGPAEDAAPAGRRGTAAPARGPQGGPARDAGPADRRGTAAPAGGPQGGPARPAQNAAPAGQRETAGPPSASTNAGDDDDDGWPEPARPGGVPRTDDSVAASPGGSTVVGGMESGGSTAGVGGPDSTGAASGRTASPSVSDFATRGGGSKRSAVGPDSHLAAEAGSGVAAGSGLAAARAAAAGGARSGGAARQPATLPEAAASGDWSDGSSAEEPPFDPDFDVSLPSAGPGYEGFDPGDEPLDDVIDEKTARQSSEQQAMQLLQDAFGAEKIGES